jgi:hypothetical protein
MAEGDIRVSGRQLPDDLLDDDDGGPKLGPCCGCGTTLGVTHVMMLPRRAPVPGTGWGCVVCGLPSDGAIAVMCDTCVGEEPLAVCFGFAREGVRVPIGVLPPGVFDHDEAAHQRDGAQHGC